MTSSVFPDVNVWLALVFEGHVHHAKANDWFAALPAREELVFCRFTQIGLLRLLTLSQVMGSKVKTQREAWKIFDALTADGNIYLVPEPSAMDSAFRRRSTFDTASPQQWADAYLAAFADEYTVTLVTFDKALAARSAAAVLLQQP